MKNESALCKMYLELLEEREVLRSRIQNNNDELNSLNRYLDTILTDENRELSIFSPRNPLHLMNDKIKEHQDRILYLEEDNRHCFREANKMDDRITELQSILKKEGFSIDPDVLRSAMRDEDHPESVFDRLMKQQISVGMNSSDNHVVAESNGSISTVADDELLNSCIRFSDAKRKEVSSAIDVNAVDPLMHCLHSIDMCSKYLNVDPMRAKMELETISNLLKETVDSLNDVVYDIQPIEFGPENLYDRLITYASIVQSRYDVRIEISCDSSIDDLFFDKMIHVKQSYEKSLYDAVRDYVKTSINVSQCKCITVDFSVVNDSLKLLIQDDGLISWDDSICDSLDKSFELLNAVVSHKFNDGMIHEVMIPCRG